MANDEAKELIEKACKRRILELELKIEAAMQTLQRVGVSYDYDVPQIKIFCTVAACIMDDKFYNLVSKNPPPEQNGAYVVMMKAINTGRAEILARVNSEYPE